MHYLIEKGTLRSITDKEKLDRELTKIRTDLARLPEYSFWGICDRWSLTQSALLLLDCDPRIVSETFFHEHPRAFLLPDSAPNDLTQLYAQFNKILHLLQQRFINRQQAKIHDRLYPEVDPQAVISWAEEKGFSVPPSLFDAVKGHHSKFKATEATHINAFVDGHKFTYDGITYNRSNKDNDLRTIESAVDAMNSLSFWATARGALIGDGSRNPTQKSIASRLSTLLDKIGYEHIGHSGPRLYSLYHQLKTANPEKFDSDGCPIWSPKFPANQNNN